MSDLTKENGESRSTPTATAAATGTGDAAASEADATTGPTAADSTASATNARRNTGKGRRTSEPLPVSDALSVFQEAARMLQASGLPVSVVNLPVSPGDPPRVAVILAKCRLTGGDLILATATDTGNQADG